MAGVVSRLNTRQRIAILSWQTPGLLEHAHLTEQQALEAAWFVDLHGHRYRGAHAISEALAVMQILFVPVRWLYAVPGLRQLADWVYQWVADNRYRFPGSTAACAVPMNKEPSEPKIS